MGTDSTPRGGTTPASLGISLLTLNSRAREIQAQEGLGHSVWGPPTSGNSTPLRETIPESPSGTGTGFPNFNEPIAENTPQPGPRGRTRAGTLPSRFSPSAGLGALNPQSVLISKTSRPTPSTSPFKPGAGLPPGMGGYADPASKASLLSRLRAGSMPQRPGFAPSSNPFGSSIFSSSYASSRDRSNTLASIRSGDGPESPAHSHFSRDSLADTDVRTLDYLGLVDTPKPALANLANADMNSLINAYSGGLQPATIAELAALTKNANRFRSYSVNAKEKYADEEEDQMGYGGYSGAMTPSGDAASYAAIHEAVRQHNAEVQAFANYASNSRPRARTAGVLESPSTHALRSYLPTPSRLDKSINVSDLSLAEESEYHGLAEAVENMQLNGSMLQANGDDHNVEAPTRALWLGNIPSSTTVSSLNMIFNNFGAIESTRVLTHKNCGFVNFENTESAMTARNQLNGKEIFPGAGPVRIGYAKVPSASGTPANNGIFPSPSPDPQAKTQASPQSANNPPAGGSPRADGLPASLETPELSDIQADIIKIVKELGATDEEQMRIAQSVEVAIQHNQYEVEIPSVNEPNHNRIHDAPRLRDIRKRIDNNTCSAAEIEEVALGMLPEIAELASDYLGNTVVQKLFEYCSEATKEAMLAEIAPHLAEIGVHKNGTWAAQKIIDVARTPALMSMIVESLRPYGMALFLDQFGNYVMQGCLRYGFPLNTFIFDAMVGRLWPLAQGRFGARAMRACLESHHATKDQQRMIAAAIALHSVQLATNANGALLLTWFLDTCTFPRRRTVLAPRLVPHLVHLCTHKVAYLTVLKIINQRNEPEARDTILQALFFSPNDQVLEEILSDQSCGATLIFKVVTTPFFDEAIRNDVVNNIRNVLLRIKAQPQQGYKRLMDEVGLSTRSGGARDMHNNREVEHARPGSKHSNANGHMQPNAESPHTRQFYQGAQGGFDQMGMQRTASMDSATFEQYAVNSPAYTPNPGMMAPVMNAQQLQYQQAMLAAARQNNYFQPMGGMNGFPSPAPSMDAYRHVASPIAAPGLSGSPLMPQSGFGQGGYNPMVGQQMYQYPMQYMPQQPMQQVGAGRRGRVSLMHPPPSHNTNNPSRDESPMSARRNFSE
jgi:protein JSN1